MSKIAMVFGKAVLLVSVAVATVATVPPGSAFALTVSAATPPPAPATVSNEWLELIWAREQAHQARRVTIFDFADQRIARIQELIDRAKANGKDVTAVQAALDALSEAFKQARPVFETTKGIVASHQGFDAQGNVTDPTLALQTVKDLGAKLKEIRTTLLPALQAFREAVRDFRQANGRTPGATTTPNG